MGFDINQKQQQQKTNKKTTNMTSSDVMDKTI